MTWGRTTLYALLVSGFAGGLLGYIFGRVDAGLSLYEFVKEFQDIIGTVVTGFIGFGGIIYTLKRNADLVRIQKEQDVAHERDIVRRALASELKVMRAELQLDMMIADEHIEASAKSGSPPIAPRPMTDNHQQLFAAVTSRLGFLEADTVDAVVHAYTRYIALVDALRYCNDLELQEVENQGAVSGKAQGLYHQRLKNTLYRIDVAIAALDGQS